MEKLKIPDKQIQSKQKAVDIIQGQKYIAINVSRNYAIEFVNLWNEKRELK